jgi:hypothetical protein
LKIPFNIFIISQEPKTMNLAIFALFTIFMVGITPTVFADTEQLMNVTSLLE